MLRTRGTGALAFLLGCASLLSAQSPDVTLTGTLQGPNGLPIANNIISFTPTQSFFVAGSGGGSACNSYVVQINGTGLTCGDTINFNTTTPAAPTNGLNVTWATRKVGNTDSVSAAVVGDGNAAHFLNGIGTYTTPASGGVTSTGTASFIPEFSSASALINSPIQDSSGTLQSSEGFAIGPVTGVGINTTRQPTSCSGGASPSFDYNVNTVRCIATTTTLNVPAASTGTNASVFGFASTTAALSATPAIAGVYGVNLNSGGGSANWQAGAVGFASTSGSSGTTANMFGVFGLGNQGGSGQTATLMAGVGGQAEQNSTTNGPFGAALFAYSPNIITGNFTHNYGLYIQDQTAGGGSDPWGIFEAGTGKNQFGGNTAIGAHLNQVASGNFAGTCTMVSGTTCTITLAASYTGTPGCVVTVQSATVIAGGCTVSGTTVTVTAASSNSSTWAALLFGNPN
jgi:hypothetical protein